MSEDVVTLPEVNIDVAKERAKPRLVSLLFADYVAITVSGKPDVCGIFDRIFLLKQGAAAEVTIFLRLLEARHGRFYITIFDPENKNAGTAEVILADVKDKPYPYFIQFVERIQIDNLKHGTYWFDVSLNGESLGGAPLTVMDVDKEKKDGN